MQEEVRRVCPYCGRIITPQDAVTQCPQCGVVHHRNCWERNSGCCTRGCAAAGQNTKDISEIAKMQHRRKSEVPAQQRYTPPPPRHIARERYDREKTERERTVPQQVIKTVNVPPAEEKCDEFGYTEKGHLSEKLKSIVQDKTYYYDSKISALNRSGKRVSWNWAAFMFPLYWFAYRKMYLYSLIVAGIMVGITMIGWIPGMFGIILSLLLNIAFNVCSGIFANAIYKYHIENVYMEGSSMDADSQWIFFHKRGGTSKPAIFVAMFGWGIVRGLLAFISTMIGIASFISSVQNGSLNENSIYKFMENIINMLENLN